MSEMKEVEAHSDEDNILGWKWIWIWIMKHQWIQVMVDMEAAEIWYN